MAFTYTTRTDGLLMKKINIPGKKPIYLYSKDKNELEKKYIETMHLNYIGATIDSNITLKQWAEKWYNVNISTKEYNTKRNIRSILDNHIYPALGNMKLKNIKVINIRELQKDMVEKGLTSTCNRTITTIKRILNDAVENDIIQKNVAFNVKAVKYTKIEKKPLSIYEDNLLLTVAKTHKYGLFYLILRYTGLRTEEIIPLTIDDIDLDSKTITVDKAIYFEKNTPNQKITKNRKSRKVPILDIIYEQLKEHIEKCKTNNQKLLFVKQTDGCMITFSSSRWMLSSFLIAINKQYEKEQKELDDKFELKEDNKIYFTNHQLRHSYCTMLYYAGIKIKKAQELMGHSSADMVYNIYTHLDNERENTTETINNYIKKLY